MMARFHPVMRGKLQPCNLLPKKECSFETSLRHTVLPGTHAWASLGKAGKVAFYKYVNKYVL